MIPYLMFTCEKIVVRTDGPGADIVGVRTRSTANGTRDRAKTKIDSDQFLPDTANIRRPENATTTLVRQPGVVCATLLTSPHNICKQTEHERESSQRGAAE